MVSPMSEIFVYPQGTLFEWLRRKRNEAWEVISTGSQGTANVKPSVLTNLLPVLNV